VRTGTTHRDQRQQRGTEGAEGAESPEGLLENLRPLRLWMVGIARSSGAPRVGERSESAHPSCGGGLGEGFRTVGVPKCTRARAARTGCVPFWTVYVRNCTTAPGSHPRCALPDGPAGPRAKAQSDATAPPAVPASRVPPGLPASTAPRVPPGLPASTAPRVPPAPGVPPAPRVPPAPGGATGAAGAATPTVPPRLRCLPAPTVPPGPRRRPAAGCRGRRSRSRRGRAHP
jgi:hypothetical protein